MRGGNNFGVHSRSVEKVTENQANIQMNSRNISKTQSRTRNIPHLHKGVVLPNEQNQLALKDEGKKTVCNVITSSAWLSFILK